MIEGTVQQINSQPRGKYGNLAYSVKMDDGVWYGHGFEQPAFGEGAYISFEEQYNGRYANIQTETVQVLEPGTAPQQQQRRQSQPNRGNQPNRGQRQAAGRASQAGGGAGGRDQYWENKEKRDIVVQRQIQHQASRNAAIELVKVAVSADALALPAKKSDKLDALVALVNELTEQFSADTAAVGKGERRPTMPQQEAAMLEQAQRQAAQNQPQDDFDDDIPF